MLGQKEFVVDEGADEEEKEEEAKTNNSQISRLLLIASDYAISFLWVLSGSIARYLFDMVLGAGADPISLLIKGTIAVLYVYCFYLLGKATNGGSYNPLLILCYAISDSFLGFLFVVFGRIPAQMIGSVMAVWLINMAFPAAASGPHLKIDASCGALVEGVLTSVIVVLSLELNKMSNYSKKTWIKCVAKVMLHVLGSDMTGGIMNPASSFGWTYNKKDMRKEYLYVYCLAPIEATLLIAWISSILAKLRKHGRLPDMQCKDKTD